MTIIAEGKDKVLQHLEAEAREKSGGKEGVYMIQRDDWGNLVAFIAGHVFIGSGSFKLGEKQVQVQNGIVVSMQG